MGWVGSGLEFRVDLFQELGAFEVWWMVWVGLASQVYSGLEWICSGPWGFRGVVDGLGWVGTRWFGLCVALCCVVLPPT